MLFLSPFNIFLAFFSFYTPLESGLNMKIQKKKNMCLRSRLLRAIDELFNEFHLRPGRDFMKWWFIMIKSLSHIANTIACQIPLFN